MGLEQEYTFLMSSFFLGSPSVASDSFKLCTTIVWEKLVVGNIHEKKLRGKKFLSQQATNHYKLLYFFVVRKFLCVSFSSSWHTTKIFSHQIFPKLRY